MSIYRKFSGVLVLLLFAFTFSTEAFAQGGRGGRGGGARSGGGARPSAGRSSAGRSAASRPQVHAPSMSRSMPSARPANRPSAQRPSPNINRPSISHRPSTLPGNAGGQRPNLPTTRPGGGNNNRPNLPNAGGGNNTRPNFPNAGGGNNTRPNFPNAGGGNNNRPNLPNAGGGNNTRPNFPNAGGGSNRPNFPTNRPSQGNVRDFLDMPGSNTRPANRPAIGSGNNNRPNIGDRTNIGNNIGGGRINTGDININRQNNINSIRNNWTNVNNRPFGHNHWTDPGFNNPRWHYHSHWNRYPGNWCWRPAAWTTFGTWFAWSAWSQPIVYDYGTNVVYRDNYIYVDDQPTVTTEVYYQQAETIAESAPAMADEAAIEWMPLGVFAIAEDGGADSGMMVQLAVSKEGIIAGTFYNQITDSSRPLEGMVDRETQRAAWKFGDGKNEDIVMETGIDNLTKDDSTALVHFGPDNTQTWLMVRLPEPEDDGSSGGDG